jgi:hypothetical protein
MDFASISSTRREEILDERGFHRASPTEEQLTQPKGHYTNSLIKSSVLIFAASRTGLYGEREASLTKNLSKINSAYRILHHTQIKHREMVISIS